MAHIQFYSSYIPAVYVSVEALEPRGTTPADAPDAPTSEAPEEVYVAVFDYQSEEPGDLCFSAGEQVKVTKKESEWWTGQIGDRTGMFPFNYVELAGGVSTKQALQDVVLIFQLSVHCKGSCTYYVCKII